VNASQLCCWKFSQKETLWQTFFEKAQFLYAKRKKNRFWGPLCGLGATYAVHLRLIGKLVVDFLLVIIELFSVGAFVLSQSTCLTDGRTDRCSYRRPRLHSCSAVKRLWNFSKVREIYGISNLKISSCVWIRSEMDDDLHLSVVALSEALMTIARLTHSRPLFAPYAEQVFDKACSNIEGQCFSMPNG